MNKDVSSDDDSEFYSLPWLSPALRCHEMVNFKTWVDTFAPGLTHTLTGMSWTSHFWILTLPLHAIILWSQHFHWHNGFLSSINLSTWSPSVIWRTKWFLKSWKARMWTFFLLIDGTNYETSKNNCKKTLIKPPSPLDAGPPPVWKIILRTTPFIFI